MTSTPVGNGHFVGNLDKLDVRFKCAHCTLLLREPMQAECGHRFCSLCVHETAVHSNYKCRICLKEDPSDAEVISVDRCYPDKAIQREIDKLNVACPFSPDCKEMLLFKVLEEHTQSCEFRQTNCPKCSEKVSLTKLDMHLEKECSHRLIECNDCKMSIRKCDVENHENNECQGNKKPCHYCLEFVKDRPEHLDKHLKEKCPVGWHKDKPCPYGCVTMTQKNFEEHRREELPLHIDRVLHKLKTLTTETTENNFNSDMQTDAIPTTATVPPVGMQGFSITGIDSDLLEASIRRLDERLRPVEDMVGLLKQTPLSKEIKDVNLQFDSAKILDSVNIALSEGKNFKELSELVKNQFELAFERIKSYERALVKETEKKMELEKKYQEIIRILAYKEVKILELERRLEVQEHASYDGQLVWKVGEITRRKKEAIEGKMTSVYSPAFYTGRAGYKMCARLYLNGDGAGKGTHLSLFFVILRGEYDALLPWPFSKKVSMMLLDQNFQEDVIDAFRPDTTSSSFKRPYTDMNIASGCPLFMPLQDFENQNKGYIKDDTIFIKIIVDKTDLPS